MAGIAGCSVTEMNPQTSLPGGNRTMYIRLLVFWQLAKSGGGMGASLKCSMETLTYLPLSSSIIDSNLWLYWHL